MIATSALIVMRESLADPYNTKYRVTDMYCYRDRSSKRHILLQSPAHSSGTGVSRTTI